MPDTTVFAKMCIRDRLCIWRANWADTVNEMLARNQINASIDHRSFSDQGITEQPTIHEGYIAQNMEKKGMIADRCEINRQIRADNQMLRELKTQVSKLAQACLLYTSIYPSLFSEGILPIYFENSLDIPSIAVWVSSIVNLSNISKR